ncbi:hypothetical protein DB32_007872 [Sandaracinus amylolyticus]|uniref:Uncharacterized protein n=1 Tax=Sandaracinus amylolyticus TaxID=927083 RepID=A0A0F6W9C9_9BACT|nr:hypothetical protein DB32_007872 [Sandaracinus amylolyticus]
MAIYYNLAAFVGARDEAEAFVAHFHGRTIPIEHGDLVLDITLRETPQGWLVGLWPVGMSYGTCDDARLVAPEAREAAARWFERELRGAPTFRAAAFGAEIYDTFLDTTLAELVDGGGMPGLVLDIRTHVSLRSPAGTKPFGPGRRWWPRTKTP